ncbi:hypothetical protein [Mycobacterium branderi]|uniref:Uncharacterized protein n=1 Tax=Mycobacterium branderi TaxID=43348 RepID=A0A7I7W4Y4_9MYCO|nr:hypothetical protein [Mycobacterium branderi]MCV7233777.1 hypothetical protein [Mycobacterium branderi]ORA39680.1 hypothetical protein BST20_09295 [Mycobacterium branderi]BBZ11741.1 hypothetical protein MBRA_19360 [Mycobacterium branderi]
MSTFDDPFRYETALRRLPDAHSLALRLRGAGVADEVICQYLQIEPEGLESVLELAQKKLEKELQKLPNS